ncbi:MAG: hypothetical protein GWN00_16510 [Aliifodinibius sp.]|nr:hypothetical protein [Fodinibius sp.]NIV12638.1 hypothetical protein [Fodinibius sp.]NIY26348.1 hypothetical protein [Fodinibius sp.]
MKTMTHRQRLQLALTHQEPDFVPLDFGTGGNTSPAPEIYEKLVQHYQLKSKTEYVPHMMRLAKVDEYILEQLDIDTRPVYMHPGTRKPNPADEPGHFYDEWGVKWKEYQVNDIIYREVAEYPLENASIDDLKDYPWWPDPDDRSRYKDLKQEVEKLYNQCDYALIGCPAFNSVWERAYLLCGYRRMLEGLILESDFVHAVFRKLTDIISKQLVYFLEQVGSYVEVIKMADDLGGQENALMSPSTYRSELKPYHKEIYSLIKKYTAAKIFHHSCGSVAKLLPDLIDAGVEVLNPVQVSAKDMDTQQLKTEFGDRLSFWGAIDTQHVLPNGTTEEVREEVRKRIHDLGAGGGYVLAPVHNIQADVPVANVLEMYTSARNFGKYPLPK